MKLKFVTIILTVAMLFGAATLFCHADTQLSLSAKSAVLMDADSDLVMLQKDAHTRMGMASTTKIMTALTVLRLAQPDAIVSIPKEAVGTEGSSVYLCAGERLTVEQLLYALLLSSANDAAVALAIFCAGSVEAFADQMNAYAQELGLENTHFVNPHGLYDEDHYTTAYELALIAKEALKDTRLERIFSTYKMPLPFEGEPNKRLAVNHNKLLRTYDGAIGMKTGFTKKTGRCLVSAARRDGLTLICVTLNAPDDWRDHTAALDYGFANFERRVIADAGEFTYDFPVVGGTVDTVRLCNSEPLALTLPKGASGEKYTVTSNHRFLYAPTAQGDICAAVTVTFGAQSATSPLSVSEAVAKPQKKNFFQRITDKFK